MFVFTGSSNQILRILRAKMSTNAFSRTKFLLVPPGTLLTEKMIEDAHVQTLHGGVGLAMASLRQPYWIPRLCRSTKKVIASCYRCKQFQVTAYHNPPVGNVPLDRTVGSTHFEVLRVDYAGPLIYKIIKTKDAKAYIQWCQVTK